MLLEHLFDAVPDALLLADSTGKLIKVNSQALALLGYAIEELVELSIEDLIPERYRESHFRLRAAYFENPVLRPMAAGQNLTARRKDGTEVPVDIMLSPLKEDQTLILVAMRDARDRQRREYELRASEAMFKALFDQAPDAVIAVDERGLIVRANRQVESLLGYPEAELKNKAIEVLIPERLRTAHSSQRVGYTACPVSRPMGAGLDLFARHKNGVEVPVDIMLSPVQIPGSKLVLSVIRDATEQKKAANQLKRSNEDLERFAYIASHDLQEPLRTIASSCNMIQKRLAGAVTAETKEYLSYATDSAKRMQELIRNLLIYSRVGHESDWTDVDLGHVMARVVENLKAQIDDSGALIETDQLPTVKGNFDQLVQLLQNLVSNAIKFRGDAKPQVYVKAALNGGVWKISVSDSGIGIPASCIDKLFVQFQRLHRRDLYPGSGIGLAICKKIVERHGGQICVKSQESKGTTFEFTLHEKVTA